MLVSCGSSQDLKVSAEKNKVLTELVAQKKFEILSDWASPMASRSLNALANSRLFPWGSTANNINLSGNGNHFRMYGDSISMYLPYYGERQISNGYNTNNNLEFDGIADECDISYHEKKQRYLIKLRLKKNTESFVVSVLLYNNLSSDITVISNHRTSISYRGRVLKLEKEDSGLIN